jgi:foldase protein PrsA
MIRFALVAALAAACGPGAKGGPTMNNHIGAPDPTPQSSSIVSTDILAREPLANNAQIKHILIGWKDSESHDPRAEQRTKADAEAKVKDIVDKLKAGGDFDALMRESSEDPGSASTARPYPVSPGASLVIEFKQLGLRLRIGEVGVVQSDYGFHIMKRVE